MGLADSFAAEDRVNVKFSDFYRLIKESTKADLIMNAVNCDVPHQHIREMATGKKENELKKSAENADNEDLTERG